MSSGRSTYSCTINSLDEPTGLTSFFRSAHRIQQNSYSTQSPYNLLQPVLTKVASLRFSMLKTLHCPHSLAACTLLLQQSIDISCRPVQQQNMLGQTDRRTDTVLLHRPCWAYHAGSANDAVLRCYQQVPFYGDYNMSSSACSY